MNDIVVAIILVSSSLIVGIAAGSVAADHGTLRDCVIKNSAILSSGAIIECNVKKVSP